jgi:hypothetical protein
MAPALDISKANKKQGESQKNMRYVTKENLVALNNHAKRAGRNCIDTGFVGILPEEFTCVVGLAVSGLVEGCWYRCWVMLPQDDPQEYSENRLLLDVPVEDFASLPELNDQSGNTMDE